MKEEQLDNAAAEHCKAMSEIPAVNSYHAFKAGALWHESLPLADRLSESEKEKFIEYYQDCADRRKSCAEANDSLNAHRYNEAMLTLEAIFGSTLFTPTEQ